VRKRDPAERQPYRAVPDGCRITARPETGLLSGVAFENFSSGVGMRRSLSIGLLVMTLASCRDYHLSSRVTDQDGLVPADQYARYGREQAEEIAIAREFAHAAQGSSPDELRKQSDAAMAYARSLPDVTGIKADPLGLLLTVQFKSGWRTMVTPLDDGKRGAATAGLPVNAGGKATK
jgi:hypothetical protein